MKKITLIYLTNVLLFLILSLVGFLVISKEGAGDADAVSEVFTEAESKSDLKVDVQDELGNKEVESNEEVKIANFLNPVPFTPQAPTANWDKEHNEGCEEASLIMAAAFLNEDDKRETLPPKEVEVEFKKLLQWQEKTFGYSLDIDVQDQGMSEDHIYHFPQTIEAGIFLQERLKDSDVILIKGSRGSKMEQVVYEIMARPWDADELLVAKVSR
jgi:hypothetical protein